jgi:hypothetical protein
LLCDVTKEGHSADDIALMVEWTTRHAEDAFRATLTARDDLRGVRLGNDLSQQHPMLGRLLVRQEISMKIPHGESVGACLDGIRGGIMGKRPEKGAKSGICANDLRLQIVDGHGVCHRLEQSVQITPVSHRLVAQVCHLRELFV